MTTQRFLEYLHDHPATGTLGEHLAEVLALRGRSDLVPTNLNADRRRIAS